MPLFVRWSGPVIFVVAFFWTTLGIWFRADDFAWLKLSRAVHSTAELGAALFQPAAQGTVRFLSERAFFIAFEKLFGLEVLPYRIAILAAQAGGCLLLAAITRRITGSSAAGFLAAGLWTVQVGLAAAIGWLSSNNQIWLALFFLGALWAFVFRRMALCWVLFLLGFGILETMVVFPLAALAFVWLIERPAAPPLSDGSSDLRRRLIHVTTLGGASCLFLLLHLVVIPKPGIDPAYAMFFDPASLWTTLGFYWRWAMGSPLATALLTFGITGIVAWRSYVGDHAPAFGLIVLLVMLAPVLPLRDHLMHYYLAAPGIGLALLLAASLERLWATGRLLRGAAVALALLFLAGHVPKSRETLRWQKEKARAVRSLVLGVEEAARLHPGKIILLAGITNELFWDGVFEDPFNLMGVGKVYLAPGAESDIDSHDEWGGLGRWLTPAAFARDLVSTQKAVVYEPAGEQLRNVTAVWRTRLTDVSSMPASTIDLGNPAFEAQLGEGWYPVENRSRWMGRKAALLIGTSASARKWLVLSGYCPRETAGLELRVHVDGVLRKVEKISEANAPFEFSVPLPDLVQGKNAVTVELEASRVFVPPGDGRALSLVFGRIRLE